MRNISLSGMATFLAVAAATMAATEAEALERAAKTVRDEAKSAPGNYQGAAGDTPAWASLSPATQAERISKGFSADDPLLRTGELRDSIDYAVDGQTAVVGSTSEYAAAHEMGTANIPQRSFLAGAAYRKADEVAEDVGAFVFTRVFR